MATHLGIQGSVETAALNPLVRPCVRGRGRVRDRGRVRVRVRARRVRVRARVRVGVRVTARWPSRCHAPLTHARAPLRRSGVCACPAPQPTAH